jgi:SAM-dependent MidA family methyltransferase
MNRNTEEMLMRSKHISYFQQHGEIFAYHSLFGYLLGMSRDLVDLLEFHDVQLRTREEVNARFEGDFEEEQLNEFLQIFRLFSCLIDSELAEERSLWKMMPVRSRWVVFHQAKPTALTFWRTDRAGQSHHEQVPPWAARLWQAIDGETALEDLYQQVSDDPSLKAHDKPRKQVLATLGAWVHHERQYLKFSKGPVSKFGPEHQWPSYLRSTMPYAPWVPGVDPDPQNPLDMVATPINPPHEYYESEVEDAEAQFETVETTLSHLFRDKTPLLDGENYASRVIDLLAERAHLHSDTQQIVEVGAGLGDFAAGVLERIRDTHPLVYDQLQYTSVDLSPALRARQQRRLEEAGVADKVSWRAGNAETMEFKEDSIDLLLCNEVVGDFTSIKLTVTLLGLDAGLPSPQDAYAKWSPQTEEKLGEAGRLIRAYDMPLRDAPSEFYLNQGALVFVEKLGAALKPKGSAWITEYGDGTQYPVASTQLDHLEFSIQFGHLRHLAQQLGLEASVEYVQELIQLHRDVHTLTTTRTYFSSLQAMLRSMGIELDKKAYSQDMFEELLGTNLTLAEMGDIRFQVIDERCMGLAPHEFKALLLRKPA